MTVLIRGRTPSPRKRPLMNIFTFRNMAPAPGIGPGASSRDGRGRPAAGQVRAANADGKRLFRRVQATCRRRSLTPAHQRLMSQQREPRIAFVAQATRAMLCIASGHDRRVEDSREAQLGSSTYLA